MYECNEESCDDVDEYCLTEGCFSSRQLYCEVEWQRCDDKDENDNTYQDEQFYHGCFESSFVFVFIVVTI